MKPRLWKYSISDESFSKYDFEGTASITLEIDKKNKIWFTDIPNSSIGSFDPSTESFEMIKLPEIDSGDNANGNIPVVLLADNEKQHLDFNNKQERYLEI